MSAPLFDLIQGSPSPVGARPASWFEQANRSSEADWKNVRCTVESWYEHYPDPTGDLRSRLRKDDQNRHSAYFELFLHELFLKSGLDVTAQPRLPSGSSPDFLVGGSDGCRIYVEATVVEGDRTDVHARSVMDAINDLKGEIPDGIGVWVDTDGSLSETPSLRTIKRQVRDWLLSLSARDVPDRVTRDAPRMVIRPTDVSGTWRAILHAMQRDISDVVLAWHSDVLRHGKTVDEALEKKARQHRDSDVPIVLAVNDLGRYERPNLVRFWQRHPTIAAVLVFDRCVPWESADRWKMHAEANPMRRVQLPGELSAVGASSIREVLGLPIGWPDPGTAAERRLIEDLFE